MNDDMIQIMNMGTGLMYDTIPIPTTTYTFRAVINDALAERGECASDVVKCTLSDSELDATHTCYYRDIRLPAFTAWTKKRVYFPVEYDGGQWLMSVPRHPCEEAIEPIGGG